MSLSPLQWRKLPVRILATSSFTTGYILDNIYDMLTGSLYFDGSARVAGTDSGWKNVTKFQTGSNTEAVYCYPPFDTVMSQSVIFSGKVSTLGASSSALPPTVTNENLYVNSQSLYVALVKSASGAFTQWTSRHPFGSSSYSTGYVSLANTTQMATNQKLIIYESTEAIAICTYNPSANSNNVIIAGAIIDPEQNVTTIDAENDGRLYAIVSTGAGTSATPTGVHTGSLLNYTAGGALFSHNTALSTATIGYPRFLMFTPQSQSFTTASVEKHADFWYMNSSGNSLNGKLVSSQLRCISSGSNFYLGRLRDITYTKPIPTNQVVRDSSNGIFGFTIAASETASYSPVATTNVNSYSTFLLNYL